jgi:hypothetical protein
MKIEIVNAHPTIVATNDGVSHFVFVVDAIIRISP